jgi:hypothetical protein
MSDDLKTYNLISINNVIKMPCTNPDCPQICEISFTNDLLTNNPIFKLDRCTRSHICESNECRRTCLCDLLVCDRIFTIKKTKSLLSNKEYKPLWLKQKSFIYINNQWAFVDNYYYVHVERTPYSYFDNFDNYGDRSVSIPDFKCCSCTFECRNN